MATDEVPGNTVNQDDSATIPSLIVSNFVTGATPQFDKLTDLSAFAQVQYTYYASIGVGKPLLGPYEALGRGYAETDAFKSKYGVLTSTFVETAYNDVFGRAPTDAQKAHFDAQISYFVKIYTDNGISAVNAALFAKGAVIGQMLGHAAIDGGSVFDYSGAAKSFIAKMGDAGFVPGQPLSNFDGEETAPPTGGGGGGGGGGGAPDTVDFTLASGVLTLSASGTYSGTLDGTNLRLVEPDGQVRSIVLANVTKIVLQQTGTKFDVAGSVLNNKAVQVDGAGVLNVTGVGFTAASGATQFEPTVNLDQLIHTSGAFVAAQSKFLVNGTVKDAIKVQWDFWDDKYVVAGQQAYTNLEINEATIRLGAKYINDIDPAQNMGGNVANAILDITGKAGIDGRSQLLHDNLLGNVGYASMSDRGFDSNTLAALRALIPDDYELRPWIGGYPTDPAAAVGVAKAFDFNKGFARPDYVSHKSAASVDAAAQFSPGILWFNYNAGANTVSGNTASGFAVTRHDGLGIELGLKAKERGGNDFAPASVDADGTVHYSVPGGSSAPGGFVPAKWSFDFSALTGLNGTGKNLTDFDFAIRIDTDPGTGVSYRDFVLRKDAGTNTYNWVDPARPLTAGFIDTDGPSDQRSQNSVNFGFNFIREMIDDNPNVAGIQPYNFGAGKFDIELVASKDGVKLVGQHIVVDVGAITVA